MSTPQFQNRQRQLSNRQPRRNRRRHPALQMALEWSIALAIVFWLLVIYGCIIATYGVHAVVPTVFVFGFVFLGICFVVALCDAFK